MMIDYRQLLIKYMAHELWDEGHLPKPEVLGDIGFSMEFSEEELVEIDHLTGLIANL